MKKRTTFNTKTVILLITLMLLGIPSRVFALSYLVEPLALDSSGRVGEYTSLAVVNGKPAISYYDRSNTSLKYIIAHDSSGTMWGVPQTIDNSGMMGKFTSLAVVNGFPAISYFDDGFGDLRFIRALDADGTAWDTPQTLDTTGMIGLYTSLAVVNGRPAISYYTEMNNKCLIYVRAEDENGDNWGSPQNVDCTGTEEVGLFTSLAVVDGRPAISYYDFQKGDLKYVRAEDENGDNWGTPVMVDSSAKYGYQTSLLVVDGHPAISYYGNSNGYLMYVRANDETGTDWGEPLILDSSADVGRYSSMALVNGKPAISYYDSTNDDLKIVFANNADGSDWGTPQVVDSSQDTGLYTSLAVVNGLPAVSYFDQSNEDLKFIRLTSVDISLSNGSASINNGAMLDFGSTALSTPVTIQLTINNGGNATMDLTAISLPSGYSLTGALSNQVAPGGSEELNIRLDAMQAGTYNGNLEISSTDSNQSSFSIALSGVVEASDSENGSQTDGEENTQEELLPATGFTPGQLTLLPDQSLENAYSEMNSLRLYIPDLNVDAAIVGVPKTVTGWDVTWLTNAQAGWLNGTAYPTWEGNTVLTAHVVNASGNPGPFARIKSLGYGDEIVIEAYGDEYVYEVRENRLVLVDNLAVVEQHEEHDWVTLVTCEYFNESTGEYLFRRVVRAVLVRVE